MAGADFAVTTNSGMSDVLIVCQLYGGKVSGVRLAAVGRPAEVVTHRFQPASVGQIPRAHLTVTTNDRVPRQHSLTNANLHSLTNTKLHSLTNTKLHSLTNANLHSLTNTKLHSLTNTSLRSSTNDHAHKTALTANLHSLTNTNLHSLSNANLHSLTDTNLLTNTSLHARQRS
jgi:hypothetical protein